MWPLLLLAAFIDILAASFCIEVGLTKLSIAFVVFACIFILLTVLEGLQK